MNFAKLNHVLIPQSPAERSRFRGSRVGRLLGRFFLLWEALTLRGRVLVLAVLLVGGFGTQVEASQVYWLFSMLLGALAAAWIARSGFSLPAVRAVVTVPKRVAVGDEARFQVRIENASDRHLGSLRVRGPYLPWDGTWTRPGPALEDLPPGVAATTDCHARFVSRGEHHLDPFRVQAVVPLGLTLGLPVRTSPCTVVVVPRIAPVAHLGTPLAHRHQPGGVALASNTGESMDLLGIRNYRPGDPLRDIHARSWARLGHPVVREYQEEYFTRVGVVVDVDRARSSERQLEAALSLAAGIVEHFSRGEALIDLLVVGEEVHPLTLGRSLGFLDQALDLLACVQPGPSFVGDRIATRLSPYLDRLSCVVFIAMDWDPERQGFVERVRASGVACRTLVVDAPAARTEQPTVTRVDAAAIEKGEALWL